MIYETSCAAETNSPSVVQTTNATGQIVFENGLNSNNENSKIVATEPSHDINLPNDEDLLKRLENADNPDAIVTGKQLEMEMTPSDEVMCILFLFRF